MTVIKFLGDSTKIRLAGHLAGSMVNGPGERTVVWFQGCVGMDCPGCWNPELHPTTKGKLLTVGEVAGQLSSITPSRNYTISGGEPFQQVDALATLITELRKTYRADSIIVYTGYTLQEINALPREKKGYFYASDIVGLPGRPTLASPDVLVSGRYNPSLPFDRELKGSKNQSLVFLTPRHSPEDFDFQNDYEIHIQDGHTIITGFPPKGVRE